MGAAGGSQNRPDAAVQADWRSLTSAYARKRGTCPPADQVVVSALQRSNQLTACPGERPAREALEPGLVSYI
jgi:hypothetical protein